MATPGRSSSQTSATLEAEHRLALARSLGLGAAIYPTFFALDIFASQTLFPAASLPYLAAVRVVATLILAATYFVIRDSRVSNAAARVTHVIGLGTAAVGVSLVASQLGGPTSAYMHGLTFVIMVRAAIVPAPVRESVAHGLYVAAIYPAVFALLYLMNPTGHADWLAPGTGAALAVNYFLVIGGIGCACIASHSSWAARRQLYQARRLGRYRLEAPLGRGGQSEVWLARDSTLDRNVALKILRSADASPEAIESFEREARLASKLSSPHAVRVHDFGASDDGIHYIAMEHLVGCDLSELVKLFGPLPPERAVHFATQACRSLEEAHDKGLVHRDVKPSNLFAAEVGDERDVLKLLDFGIARSLLEGTHSNATRTGTVRGTPAYLAPECCKGETATPASDLYGLGATLYHLVTGSPPFVGDDLSIVAQHREDTPVRPSVRRGAELPAGLEEIILRCLAKDPGERFSSARTLREALERCEGITSWEPSDAARFWEQERKETVRRWTDETRV